MKVIIKYDKHGNVKKVKGDVGRTRMNRGALYLWKGDVQHTTHYKIFRFIRRIFHELTTRADAAACYHTVGTRCAAEIPYIGMLEDARYE